MNVVLTLETQRATVIPAEAIQAGQQGSFVYVVKADQTVEPRPVMIGQTVGGKVIVESGVMAGETVVTDGQSRLYPGAKISIATSPDASVEVVMHFSHIFIERPIMTTLITFAILLFGIVGFRALPVAALPSVDYPTIQVTATQPGANPETMASSIATPLEREFSTIAGVRSISSSNAQGVTTITIQFALDRDVDAAAQDVQSAIAQAVLPPMPRPPSYAKQNPSEQPILYFALNSTTLPLYTVNEYAETAARPAHLHGQRRLARSGLRRAEVCRSHSGGSGQAGRASASESTKCSAPFSRAT